MLTMMLGGLWHGAGWTFVNWGIFHGLLLIGYRIYENRGSKNKEKSTSISMHVLKVIIMFHFVCISWLLFRADSMTQVWDMLNRIILHFYFTEFSWYALGMILFFAGPLLILEYLIERSGNMLYLIKTNWLVRGGIYSYFAIMIVVFTPLLNQEFIYFQF